MRYSAGADEIREVRQADFLVEWRFDSEAYVVVETTCACIQDYQISIEKIHQRVVGDSNGDGVFNSSDLIIVFSAGLYEEDGIAGWQAGDWNCDGKFNSTDLIAVFTDGSYERTAHASSDVAARLDAYTLDERVKKPHTKL